MVRKPSYKYSGAACDLFFSNPEFAFLFVFFASNEGAKDFSDSYFKQEEDARIARIKEETQRLALAAQKALEESQAPQSKAFLTYLANQASLN